ncbi:MAG: MATE family efflux transporter, partial [Spirochaetales bacterium]|nr:MATE family efflux transporter [Candidatus Physcosoma equi]
MAQENKEFLGKEPVGKLLFKLGIPTVVAQLINMLYNIVDRVYIGHMPHSGSLALTGVGVCLPILMIIMAFSSFAASGAAPRASIALGKGDKREAERYLGGAVALQIVLSIVLTLVLLLWNRPILLSFGASENTIGYASSYISVYALGTIFVQLTMGLNAFITAQGDTSTSMKTVLLGAVSNIILDPIFIFVFKMGVVGAATATVISQCLSALWCVYYLTKGKSFLKIQREHLKLSKDVILPSLVLGSAAFIMMASESIISICFNSSLLKYGGDIAVGAMTICTSASQMIMLPIQGLSQGAQPITSYNYGAGNKERVKRTYFLLALVCTVFTLVLWTVIQLFPRTIAGIFTSEDALLTYSSRVLRIYAGCVFLFGLQISCQMTFVAI